jgi:D-alanine-D-alanine ligase
VGKRIYPEDFKYYFDFAFLALHGSYGEDGNIQGILEWVGIPYSGAGIYSSAFGINKSLQADLLGELRFERPRRASISRQEWLTISNKEEFFERVKQAVGLPFVVKAAHQGSSVGISIIKENDFVDFLMAMDKAFFLFEELTAVSWATLSEEQRVKFVTDLADIRHGIGMPVVFSINSLPETEEIIYHPEELLTKINTHFLLSDESVRIEALDGEQQVLFEAFIDGKEFSCIVIQDEQGKPIALPPTQIITNHQLFDYRSKYLPGMARKITPIDLPISYIHKIQDECCRLFEKLHFNVYARIDGFCTESGIVYLNDPNTTSGMLPSSFFFHQAAEIGLNPSQFLTYIIRTSLAERIKDGKRSYNTALLLKQLETQIASLHRSQTAKIRVGVIMGGYSSERHISVESGRNVYEKLASSDKYLPIPIFLTGNDSVHELYRIPINIMLKDNADDIKEKIQTALTTPKHEIITEVIERTAAITNKYAQNTIFMPEVLSYSSLAEIVDVVFIALHGRPGEDGAVQLNLEYYNIPYNGSGIDSSRTTIDKFKTNEILAQNGISVAAHKLLLKTDWLKNPVGFITQTESEFSYPFIAKPSDDGCSSAVKKIKSRIEFEAFLRLIFRETPAINSGDATILGLHPNEEFPRKDYFVVETLISAEDADMFLEITGGLLTKYENGKRVYEMFEPSETLALGEVLSLEEKFLAGEGQNITPARYSKDPKIQKYISEKVRADLQKTAEILNVEGYARIDAFVRIKDGEAETIVIEVNSLPGMTPATCIFHQTAINGYTPYHFIDKILQYGMQRAKFKSIDSKNTK